MKKDIHPKVYNGCAVTCACGSSFVTTSTKPTLSVDICSACHPFYTGQQKFVDTEGRIEKFEKKLKLSKSKQEKVQTKKAKKAAKKATQTTSKKQPTLKDLLVQARKEVAE